MEQTTNLLDLDRAQLAQFFHTLGERGFRASQVMKWIHQQGTGDFSSMTNLSKDLRTRLAARARVTPPQVVQEQISCDGTRKWLMRVDGDNCVETVFIPESGRGTLCVSSQVGCALNCQFCATATQGFSRNLRTAEIIGQLWQAVSRLRPAEGAGRAITNVVLMGMGEPLLNLNQVAPALNIMLDDFAYGLSRRRVTVSTAGVVPGIDRLRELSSVSLAVSLHAPNDALRDQLVPINRKYPLKQLMEACRRYATRDSHAHITFEYVMLADINDSSTHARELARLLGDVPAKINLIPFNPYPGARYTRSSERAIDTFRDVLMAQGYNTMTRKTRGADIDAACGQLVGQVQARRPRHRKNASEAVA